MLAVSVMLVAVLDCEVELCSVASFVYSFVCSVVLFVVCLVALLVACLAVWLACWVVVLLVVCLVVLFVYLFVYCVAEVFSAEVMNQHTITPFYSAESSPAQLPP